MAMPVSTDAADAAENDELDEDGDAKPAWALPLGSAVNTVPVRQIADSVEVLAMAVLYNATAEH
jgi:hypothetical protein